MSRAKGEYQLMRDLQKIPNAKKYFVESFDWYTRIDQRKKLIYFYIVMEYLPHGSLQEYMKNEGKDRVVGNVPNGELE
jgi:serine/threonine protein kinase